MMDVKEILLSLIMVVSAFILAYRSLAVYGQSDPWLMLAAVMLIAAMAALLISICIKLNRIEHDLIASERVLRVGIQSVEESLEASVEDMNSKYRAILDDITKRIYR
jgi:hypothetical protein